MVASPESAQVLRFGVFELDQRARELRRQGNRIRLQEQPFRVLALLLERAGDVVTREELRQKLWPSSVYVDFDHGLNNAIARLRETLGDAAATPHFIETLPKLGYRFIYPLSDAQASEVTMREAVAAGESPTEALTPGSDIASLQPSSENLGTVEVGAAARETHRGAGHWTNASVAAATVAAIVVIALLAGLWVTLRPADAVSVRALPRDPSVAVLPFVNMSSDAESEYFADGLSEELISKLAGIRGLKVASRTSSFHFKGKREPVAAIAQQLQVNHVLEGSVRHSGGRVRITAQLIDARDGYQHWSQTFDRDFTDIFQIQDDIALAVANGLQVKLLEGDQQRLRSRGTRDAEAYRLYLTARGHMSWLYGRPDWAEMKRSYEQAIARDPEFAAAHAGLAHYYFNRERNENGLQLGRAAAERAAALDPELSEAVAARANFEFLRYSHAGDFKAYAQVQADFRRALELDPSNSLAMFHYGRAVLWSDPDLALRLFERTVQLDPMRLSAVGFGASIVSMQGRHEEGLARVRQLYEQNPETKFHTAIHVANLEYYGGNLGEAAVYLREALPRGDIGRIHLWALQMSLGDLAAARATLVAPEGDTLSSALHEAAGLTMDGHYAQAFALLDRRRAEFPVTRALDVPAARLALIAAKPASARAILEPRLPDLVTLSEPINARNVLPALDLAAAWAGTGEDARADALLAQVAAFLDGPVVPRWPMFMFLRARAHALAGEPALAQQALERAYSAGFRTTWAIDLLSHPFFYMDSIEVDPAFATVRKDPRFKSWLARVKADNAHQLEQLRARDAEKPAA